MNYVCSVVIGINSRGKHLLTDIVTWFSIKESYCCEQGAYYFFCLLVVEKQVPLVVPEINFSTQEFWYRIWKSNYSAIK